MVKHSPKIHPSEGKATTNATDVFLHCFGFCFEFEPLRAQPCWFALYTRRTEKIAWYTLLQYVLALFMTENSSDNGRVFATLNLDFFFFLQTRPSMD